MKIIPVIDLKNGLVVSAHLGDRNNYQPINSPLSTSSNIENIIDGFLTIYPFEIIYIADLDAITKTGDNQQLINKISFQYSSIEFWVDSGSTINDLLTTSEIKYRPILGSESQPTINLQRTRPISNKFILSLDFFPIIGYSGPAELLDNPVLWPKNIIIMSLEHVGTTLGPDIDRLSSFCQTHPDKNFIAAGGVRNEEDLLHLKQIGITHALIASALHSGVVNHQAIKKLTPN